MLVTSASMYMIRESLKPLTMKNKIKIVAESFDLNSVPFFVVIEDAVLFVSIVLTRSWLLMIIAILGTANVI